ncbi:hypothetical protein ACFRJ8_01210 [Arthrobacter sp. NPDC056886]|uniref:hypothetical protein n=1 Tax=Arthrobacter sp. NPDC056886 TaxID=3345960 RepID=UPI00366C4CAB
MKNTFARLGVAAALSAALLASAGVPAQASEGRAGTLKAIAVQAEFVSQYQYLRVTGSPAVGHVLRAVLGTWATGATVTYQWALNGVPIAGATRTSYVPVTSDLNKRLTVTATGTKPGSVTQVYTSDQTSRVYIAYIKSTGPVLISGSLTTGSWLSASQGAWNVPGVTLFRHWMRNGIDIPGWQGVSNWYQLTTEDVGAKISVRTVAGKYSYRNSVPVVSAETGVITKGLILSFKAPAITGTAKVGRVLSTTAGTWNVPGLTVKYQWYAGGVAVPGATSKTFTPTLAQAGKTLKAKVSVSKSGYIPASVFSAVSATVAR